MTPQHQQNTLYLGACATHLHQHEKEVTYLVAKPDGLSHLTYLQYRLEAIAELIVTDRLARLDIAHQLSIMSQQLDYRYVFCFSKK